MEKNKPIREAFDQLPKIDNEKCKDLKSLVAKYMNSQKGHINIQEPNNK